MYGAWIISSLLAGVTVTLFLRFVMPRAPAEPWKTPVVAGVGTTTLIAAVMGVAAALQGGPTSASYQSRRMILISSLVLIIRAPHLRQRVKAILLVSLAHPITTHAPGTTICVRTGEGRFAFITVKKLFYDEVDNVERIQFGNSTSEPYMHAARTHALARDMSADVLFMLPLPCSWRSTGPPNAVAWVAA